MSTFTIDAENNITAHVTLPAGADESQSFSTAKELAKLTADWPVSCLVDTGNSFAGVTPFDDLKPVKKFTNRKAAAFIFISKAIAETEYAIREASAWKVSKSTLKEHRRRDGPYVAGFPSWDQW